MMLGGLNVVVSQFLPRFKLVQFRFPRSKKKRIRKKWSKQERNFKLVKHEAAAWRVGDTLYVHPTTYIRLKEMYG